jgi:hypothetical protein
MKNFSDLLATEQHLDVVINGTPSVGGLHDPLTFDQNDMVTVDGIDILPRYRHMAVAGVLHIDQAFYCWYHTVSGQGWLLTPQISSNNDSLDDMHQPGAHDWLPRR